MSSIVRMVSLNQSSLLFVGVEGIRVVHSVHPKSASHHVLEVAVVGWRVGILGHTVGDLGLGFWGFGLV